MYAINFINNCKMLFILLKKELTSIVNGEITATSFMTYPPNSVK